MDTSLSRAEKEAIAGYPQKLDMKPVETKIPQSMTYGEARNMLTEVTEKEIEKVISKKKNDPNYYILVAAVVHNMDISRITNKIILLSELPDMYLGTILYYVDNRKGEMTRLWVLPRDVHQPANMISEGDYSDEIFHQATVGSRGKVENR